jgi:Reverse transcriptase (RNA-dependent DNA polymerase)
VLRSLLFTLYISPLAKVISSFGVNHSQFADDTQLYIALKDDNSTSRLSECFHEFQHWLDLNGLSMNPDKTEAIVIGTSA